MEIRDVVNNSDISDKLQHAFKFIHENNIDFNFTIQELYDELSTRYTNVKLNDSDGKKYIIINLQDGENAFNASNIVNERNEWSKFVINCNSLNDNTIVIKPVTL